MFLLLKETDFKFVKQYLDVGLFLDVSKEQCHERLTERRVTGGRDPVDAEAHYQRVDAPNYELVYASKEIADYVFMMQEGLISKVHYQSKQK
jgi:pantothenate kinase